MDEKFLCLGRNELLKHNRPRAHWENWEGNWRAVSSKSNQHKLIQWYHMPYHLKTLGAWVPICLLCLLPFLGKIYSSVPICVGTWNIMTCLSAIGLLKVRTTPNKNG